MANTNLNYDNLCKIVGDLFLTSKLTVSQLEEQCRQLLFVNEELKKSLAASVAQKEEDVKENVNDAILPTGPVS